MAGAAALAGASQSYGIIRAGQLPANIVGHDPASTTSPATVSRFMDLDGNGTNDLQIAYRSFTSGGIYQLQQMFVFALSGQTAAYGPVGPGSQYYAYDFQTAEEIPGGHSFGQNPMFLTQVVTNVDGTDYAIWSTGERASIGFTFRDASNQLDYGYLEIEMDAFMNAGSPGGVRFFSLAYEDSGGPILAAFIPEPSTLAALAFGGAGLAAAAFRRRKKS